MGDDELKRLLTLDVDMPVPLTSGGYDITWNPTTGTVTWVPAQRDTAIESARKAGVKEGHEQAKKNYSYDLYMRMRKRAQLANQRADQAESDYRTVVAQLRKVTEERNATQRRVARLREDIARLKQPAPGPASGFLTPDELMGRLREQGNELDQLRRFKIEACQFVSDLRYKIASGSVGTVLRNGIPWPDWSIND